MNTKHASAFLEGKIKLSYFTDIGSPQSITQTISILSQINTVLFDLIWLSQQSLSKNNYFIYGKKRFKLEWCKQVLLVTSGWVEDAPAASNAGCEAKLQSWDPNVRPWTKLTMKFKSSSYFLKKLFYMLPVSDNPSSECYRKCISSYRFISMFLEQLAVVEGLPAYTGVLEPDDL